MALSRLGTRNRPGDFTWPGFVDALASLLMVFVFVLMVFVLIQANLAYRLSGQDASLSALRQELSQLSELLSLEREASSVLSADLARTNAQLAAAEEQNISLAAQLETLSQQFATESDKSQKLQRDLDAEKAALADLQRQSTARTKAFDAQLSETSQRLSAQTDALSQQTKIASEATMEVERLTLAMESLRSELSRLRSLLAKREKQAEEDKIAIANLGKALNNALANKVQELRRFRSEFFGRLRNVLEGRSDVKVVGDRFIFQSEVLFDAGRANIGDEGQAQLAQIAMALTEIIDQIPEDIPWILQIDGHTDDVPVSGVYADNWDLSTERALSVVRFMIKNGVPASRLAASGYGEFQPIATGNTDADRQKNRRIELKLTQRVQSE